MYSSAHTWPSPANGASWWGLGMENEAKKSSSYMCEFKWAMVITSEHNIFNTGEHISIITVIITIRFII